MFICNCNAIREKQVKIAFDSGASHWRQVHTYYKRTPSCGKCEPELTEIISALKQDGGAEIHQLHAVHDQKKLVAKPG
ncbi:MAG: (2Fe-2S)-binding protein [Pseudomonadota bacterium]|nr:(2Fe-2S)-binding protein [Pseudomonadota bacterium]